MDSKIKPGLQINETNLQKKVVLILTQLIIIITLSVDSDYIRSEYMGTGLGSDLYRDSLYCLMLMIMGIYRPAQSCIINKS